MSIKKSVDVTYTSIGESQKKFLFWSKKKELLRWGIINTYSISNDDPIIKEIIDEVNRNRLDMGTKRDTLAYKALTDQYEYTGVDNIFIFGREYFRVHVLIDHIDVRPLEYGVRSLYTEEDVNHMNKYDITDTLTEFMEKVKNTYIEYIKLYETREVEYKYNGCS